MFLAQALPTLPENPQLSNAKFTCIACQMAFPSTDLQRAHYRTDWHKYNLKRKIAELAPVTSYQFNEKVLAQQAKGQEERDREGMVYHCDMCRKTYGSEASYETHTRSKKHKEAELHQDSSIQPTLAMPTAMETDSRDEKNATHLRCLFCDELNPNFDTNMDHMSTHHGFFLPDVEYLVDAEGLISYLSNKVRCDFSCLYCNKILKSSQATMDHMIDKGHSKMAYDDTEDTQVLLLFYDFEIDFNGEGVMNHAEAKDGELLLQNGTRLGHRHLLKYYKQRHHRSDEPHDDVTKTITSSSSLEIATEQPMPESLLKNRKERRHPHLAITDGGMEEQRRMTIEGIHQAAKKQSYQSSIVVKQNKLTNLRNRAQNPI